jgi:hypothetical protein
MTDDATRPRYLLEQETIMKKIIILMALAFALAPGSVTVMTVHPQQATASKPAAVRGSVPVLMFQRDPWHRTVPLSI